MNSLQIEYFLALAEHKNFTNTAKALYVSQPAISKQIASLEKELGFSLFFRSNRNVSLTPAGMIFLKAFTEATKIYINAMKEAKATYSEKSKRLRLGCVDGMEIGTLLNKIFASFHEHFPNAEYILERDSPNDLMNALDNDELDAIITLESLLENDSNLNSSVFLTTQHLLFVPANHPALSNKPFDISAFKDEPFIVLSPKALPSKKDDYIEWIEKNGFTPNNRKYVPNVESQMLTVEAGLGIAIGDQFFRLYNNPLLRSIKLKTCHKICFAWKKNNPNLLIQSFAKLASQINNTTHKDE